MKNILIGTLLLLTAGIAHAAPDCRDIWGNRAVLQMLDGKHLQIEFSTKSYPKASSLSYNGSNSTSHYFVAGSKMAQLQKTIFTTGMGSFWYQFPTSPYSHPGKTTQKFICR